MSETTELACRLIGAELSERKAVIATELLDNAEAITELPAGYELRFVGSDDLVERVFEFARLERQCCPFIRFEVGLSPNDGPVTLRLLGNPDVKRFIAGEILTASERRPEITPKRYSAD
jgi:hypothetical protein